MMRKSLWIIALVFAAIGAPSVVRADPTDITYTVSETVGAGNVTGFITTNGTIGTLNSADIVDWNLTLNDGTNPTFDLEGPDSGNNSQEDVFGNNLTANATQLLFNFGGDDEAIFIIHTQTIVIDGPYLCYTPVPAPCNPLPAGIGLTAGTPPSPEPIDTTKLSGIEVIATVTPEPSTAVLWLTGIVLIIGTRKRIAQLLRLDTGTNRSLSPH